MNDQQRSLLAAGLSFVILIGWYMYFGKNTMTPSVPATQAPAAMETPKAALMEVDKDEEKTETVEKTFEEKRDEKQTSVFKLLWTNRGGRLASVSLSHFQENVSKGSPPTSFM